MYIVKQKFIVITGKMTVIRRHYFLIGVTVFWDFSTDFRFDMLNNNQLVIILLKCLDKSN